ncbi:MAG TPA: hypothetical protein VM198_05055 [Longimicrobiales bacterium]|nr:hypothetical protein [Longimicrobiales bacterium]
MTFRLSAAFAAIVFVVTSGITAMEVHQLGAHGPVPDAAAALQRDAQAPPDRQQAHGQHAHHGHVPDQDADDDSAHAEPSNSSGHSGHSGHSQHGSSDDCTCVGPCASGAPPTLADASFSEVGLGETDHERVVPMPERLVPQDPRSHLLPLPNGPPVHV